MNLDINIGLFVVIGHINKKLKLLSRCEPAWTYLLLPPKKIMKYFNLASSQTLKKR